MGSIRFLVIFHQLSIVLQFYLRKMTKNFIDPITCRDPLFSFSFAYYGTGNKDPPLKLNAQGGGSTLVEEMKKSFLLTLYGDCLFYYVLQSVGSRPIFNF